METFDNTANGGGRSPVRRKVPANPLRGHERVWYQRRYSHDGNNSYTAEASGFAARIAAAKENASAMHFPGARNCRDARDAADRVWWLERWRGQARSSATIRHRSRREPCGSSAGFIFLQV